jgi:hypothetical protein
VKLDGLRQAAARCLGLSGALRRLRGQPPRFLQAGNDKTAGLDYRDKVFSLTTRPFDANDSA